MSDGTPNGNGNGSVLAIFDPKDLKELTTVIRGLNMSIVNLTNAVNRFTMATATDKRDRSQIDTKILAELEEIRAKVGA